FQFWQFWHFWQLWQSISNTPLVKNAVPHYHLRLEVQGMIEGIKWDICCAARVLYRAGLSVGVAGHLSVAIGENKMLMNRFGPSFATLRPADIVTFDFHGKVIEHDPSVDPYVNDTVALHAVIHRYNPQIVAVAHTHPPMAITWSTFRRVPEVYDQESCMLADDVAIVEEDYAGLAASEDRVKPFALAL